MIDTKKKVTYDIADAKEAFKNEAKISYEKELEIDRKSKYKFTCVDCNIGCTSIRCKKCSVKRRIELNAIKRKKKDGTDGR